MLGGRGGADSPDPLRPGRRGRTRRHRPFWTRRLTGRAYSGRRQNAGQERGRGDTRIGMTRHTLSREFGKQAIARAFRGSVAPEGRDRTIHFVGLHTRLGLADCNIGKRHDSKPLPGWWPPDWGPLELRNSNEAPKWPPNN